jgi:hypothetical protein
MIRVGEKGYYIEACLSSNKRLGIIDKRSDYPLGVMLLLGVHVVIGTDGGRLYSTTLPEEYAHAVHNLEKFHSKLKLSNEIICLPNGDNLCYKHILPFIEKSKFKAAEKKRDQPLTYVQLGDALDPTIVERISVATLVGNANQLLHECYPNVE